jgi:predicted nucleic acid-binding protein
MADRLVVNTGPIIALARAEALDVAAKLPIEFVSPIEVLAELDEGTRQGHPSMPIEWVRFLALDAPISPIAVAELDRGEAAVIQLALQETIGTVVIDERKGRRAAAAVGLRVTGTLGLLGRAKVLGIIPTVRPYVDRMQARSVWFDEALVQRFLAQLGE